jgi:RES domain-containing protein
MAPTVTLSGDWFRCVSLKRDPLSEEGARLNGGRFNVVGEPALYLASTPALAVAEHLSLGEMFGVVTFPPRLLVTVEVDIQSVVDLTDPQARTAVGVDSGALRCDWRGHSQSSRTQLLGRELRNAGVAGVRFPSSVDATKANLVVFRENVGPADLLRVLGAD